MTTSERDGTIIAAGGSRRSGARRVRWTARKKGEFLDELAATCNVAASAAAIGLPPYSVYTLRRRDDAFAESWQAALAQGYQMLETQLVGHALAGGGPVLTNGDPARPAIDVELAIKLLSDHRSQAARGRAVGGPRPKVATRAETDAVLFEKLKAIESRLGLSAVPPAVGPQGGPEGGQ